MALTKDELLKKRAQFVQDYIQTNNKKGIKVIKSVAVLSENVLFISERQIYKDLKKEMKY